MFALILTSDLHNTSLTGFQYKNSSGNSFDDFPGGITAGLQAYAANSEECIDASMTTFLQHVPFILLGNN